MPAILNEDANVSIVASTTGTAVKPGPYFLIEKARAGQTRRTHWNELPRRDGEFVALRSLQVIARTSGIRSQVKWPWPLKPYLLRWLHDIAPFSQRDRFISVCPAFRVSRPLVPTVACGGCAGRLRAAGPRG